MGGYEGLAENTQHAAGKFTKIPHNPKIWPDVRPILSLNPLLYLKAIQPCEADQTGTPGIFAKVVTAMRVKFFVNRQDIAALEIQNSLSKRFNLATDSIQS